MKRSMMQIYVKDSKRAVENYIRAFDGKIISKYMNDEGSYYHCEIKIDDVILAVSEVHDLYPNDRMNVMQFCFHYHEDEERKIHHAFEILQIGSVIHHPLSSTDYAKLMVDFTDEFGIRWCLFC